MAWGNSFDAVVKPMQEAIAKAKAEIENITGIDTIHNYILDDPATMAEPLQPKTPWVGCDSPKLDAELAAWIVGWPDPIIPNIHNFEIVETLKKEQPKLTAWDLGSGERQATAIIKDGKVEKVYDNKVPTHDPYTNPNAHIYYECGCGAILDPGTKRFAELNNCASNAGWKIRFGDSGYVPYCVECGKGVE